MENKQYEEVLLKHRSVRRFDERPVDSELVKKLVRCGQHAPTSEYIQAYTVINITDRELQKQIYDEVADQKPLLYAPVLLMFLADINRLYRAAEMNGEEVSKEFSEAAEIFLVASMDTAIMAQTVEIAAEMEGLGCTYIGGVRNNLGRLCELLQLPKGVYPLFGMVMGYPKENGDEMLRPRLPFDVVYKENRYDTEGDEAAMRAYDEEVREYYIARTGGKRDETWTMQMSDFVQKSHRPGLKSVLEKQGFALK